MITEGTITKIIYDNEHKSPKAKVHLDLFDTARIKSEDMECSICYPPGMSDSYKIGDIVFVDFIENEISKPVILGRLYSDTSNNESPSIARGYLNLQKLDVDQSAQLPASIKIGSVTGSQIEKAVSNSLLLEDRSIDLQGGSFIDYPIVTVCRSTLENLYGYDADTDGFGSRNDGNYFTILKDSRSELTALEVEQYMEIMTGVQYIPTILISKFRGAFLFTNGTVGYPQAVFNENTNKYTLKIVKVTTNHFTTESDVENILDSLANPVSITDVSENITRVSGGIGASIESTSDGSVSSSTGISIIDIYDEN